MIKGDVVSKLDVSAYTVPTDAPEADGTYAWNKTTMVLVEVGAAGKTGLGYTYADESTAELIRKGLSETVCNRPAMDVQSIWNAMHDKVRNLGHPGICAMGISAVDTALWDLKARILDVPLVTLLGQVRDGAPIYGSGGFTSYSKEQLQAQLGGWASEGIPRVKMKVGTRPEDDLERVKQAREAIGPNVELFVDANGAYTRTQALDFAQRFRDLGVTWFEEPRPSDDLEGLRFMRDRAPAGMDIAAGEYGYTLTYFRRMLEAEAVDVLQADASRCGGITGFLGAAKISEAFHTPFSAHCAPSLHAHPACAATPLEHIEYFHDHARIEAMFFDGVLNPKGGRLCPDLSRPGNGLVFKREDAAQYRVA